MKTLTLIIPGLSWSDKGDWEYLIPQLQLPSLLRLLSSAKKNICRQRYSDFFYSISSESSEGSDSLAQYYVKRLGLERKWKSYLLASPTHLRIDRDRILISESELLQLNSSESEQLICLLNEHFVGECEFFAISDELWLLGSNIDYSELFPSPILDIIGENISHHLPQGANALKLNALANEVQMLLFDCELNKSRVENGLLAINGIWLWNKPRQLLPEAIVVLPVVADNPQLGTMINDLSQQLIESNTIIIEQLYYPNCYRDAYSWVQQLNLLDEKLFFPLLNYWFQGQVNQIKIIIPTVTSRGLEFTIGKWHWWRGWKSSANLVELFNG